MRPLDPILLEVPCLGNNTDDKIQFYQQRVDILEHLLWYQGVINNPILIALSIYTLHQILCVRRRREIFLVLIPILFCINSLWWFYDSLGQLVWNLDFDGYFIYDSIAIGLYSLSHWVFAAQYLRTSLLLPMLFKQSLLKF